MNMMKKQPIITKKWSDFMFTANENTFFKPRNCIGTTSNFFIINQSEKTENVIDLKQKMLVDTANLMKLLDCGKHTAIEIGNLAHAKVCFGRKLFWNVKLIQQYVDCIAE